MLNFLGPLRKTSSSSTPPPSPSPTSADKSKKAGNEADKSLSTIPNCSNVNGELPKRKVEIKSDAGANGTIPGGVVGVGAAAGGEPPGNSELDELKERTSDVANESLMSTRRMAELCENAKDAGIKIIVALDDQKEQLDRVQDSLTVMREDLIQAESNIRGMEKCCGIFNNPFKKSTFKEDETLWKDPGDGVVANSSTGSRFIPSTTLSWPLNKNSSHHHSNSNNGPGPGSGFSGGYIPRITDDKGEEEMDKNMDLVSSMLGNLRNMAIDMNTEIESQNKQMNIINDMTEQNNARIDDAIQRTHDLKRQ